jgi:hypothetical protein
MFQGDVTISASVTLGGSASVGAILRRVEGGDMSRVLRSPS